jgi:hypothetical protein
MNQAKKKGIPDGPVVDKVVVGRSLDIGIGIVEEIGKRITAFKKDPGAGHRR